MNNTTQKVFVVGYEPLPPNAVGGFDWFFKEELAAICYDNESKKDGYIVYRGELEVHSTNRDEITKEIEIFLDANDWQNAFKNNTPS